MLIVRSNRLVDREGAENMSRNSPFATNSDPFAPKSPARRKTGTRAKLAKKFFEDVYAAWEEQGDSVIARAFFHDPVASLQMVARLMPQKIEVSTPTDGMSDERLAELLDHYEQLAGLKAEAAKVIQGAAVAVPSPHNLTHENGAALDRLEGRGGGPLRREGGGGINTPHTLGGRPAETTSLEHGENATEMTSINASTTLASELDDSEKATIAHLMAPPSEKAIEPEILAADPISESRPYPVGRPFAKPDHVQERDNRAGLIERDIDPASLF